MFTLKGVFAVLLIVGAIVIFWYIQKRLKGDSSAFTLSKKKEDRATTAELEAFMAGYRRDKAAGLPPAASLDAQRSSDALIVAALASPETSWKMRPVFLSGGAKLGYLLLKAALPDHYIFANTRVAELIDAPASNPLANLRIDLVVCNRALAIVAALDADGRANDALEQEKERRIVAAGIRYFRFPPTGFPKPAELRKLIYPE